MKIKICAIAKNEGAYLARWIHHHLYFGFSEILIYLNDCTDNSVEIMEKISKKNPSIKYSIVDEMRIDSLSKNRSFQVDAYNHMYNISKNDGADYVIFLDIDEYWTPKDFKSKIQDLIDQHNHTNFDAFSFSWMIDFPDQNQRPLQNPINGSMKLLRNYHVKTLFKVSERVERISVHNHTITNGIYLLDDGADFEELDPIEQHRKSKVLPEYFEKNLGNVPKYFIYHALFRSQGEYLVSLISRGSLHMADQSIFKKNRWGFVYDNNKPVINFQIDYDALVNYHASYEEFIKHYSILENLHEAELNFYKRYYFALKLVEDNPDEVKKFPKLFNGLTIIKHA
jgi:hypothetical protein